MASPIMVSIIHDHWIIHWATVFVPIAVSFAVVYFSANQWSIAQEKLRLDLYARRYVIYARVVDYQRAVSETMRLGKSNFIKLESAEQEFWISMREVKFLFRDDSGISDQLKEIDLSLRAIKAAIMLDTDEKYYLQIAGEMLPAMNKLSSQFYELEKLLAPYLNFHSVNGVPSLGVLGRLRSILAHKWRQIVLLQKFLHRVITPIKQILLRFMRK